jgi:hypothetical protein
MRGPVPIRLELSPELRRYAEWVGRKRYEKHVGRGTKDRHGMEKDLETDILSCCAEALVAEYFDLEWHALGEMVKVDVGECLQVRHTIHDMGCLLVHEDDRLDHPFILVTGEQDPSKKLAIRGWLLGKDCMRKHWWGVRKRKQHPCYWVPIDALLDMTALPEQYQEGKPLAFPGQKPRQLMLM